MSSTSEATVIHMDGAAGKAPVTAVPPPPTAAAQQEKQRKAGGVPAAEWRGGVQAVHGPAGPAAEGGDHGSDAGGGHLDGHLRRDAVRVHPLLPIPRQVRRLLRIHLLHGRQRRRRRVPAAVTPLFCCWRRPAQGHRRQVPAAHLRHDHGGACDGGGFCGGSDRVRGA